MNLLGDVIEMSHPEAEVTVPLREYLDVRFNAIESRLSSMDVAVKLANANLEHRLESMNEFRDSMKDQAAKYVTRAEALTMVIAITAVINIVIRVVNRVM
jgi:hypothetical protein